MTSCPQAYYTSSTTGLRGGAKGFQFNAATPGIASAVLECMERLSFYSPPLSAPLRPGAAEITRLPVSLFSARLPEGGAIVGQTRYLGTDYSGRYGNFFSHTIYAENIAPLASHMLPIELWHAPLWASSEVATTSLPPIAIGRSASVITRERVVEFLRDARRRQYFPTLLTAAEEALRSNRRIILVDGNDEIALWIAAVSYSLPIPLAWNLTFSTYLRNPTVGEFLIAGTTPDGDFKFSDYALRHEYSVFDFAGDRFSDLEPSPFARMASAHFVDTPGFVAFAAQTAPDLNIDDLPLAFSAFHLAQGRMDGEEEDAVPWIVRHINQLTPGQLANVSQTLLARGELDACGTVYRAAVTYCRGNATAVEAVERPYIQSLIQAEETSALDPLLDDWPQSPTLSQSAIACSALWQARMETVPDGASLCRLLRFGCLGGLQRAHDSDWVYQLARDHLVPHLASGEAIWEHLKAIAPLEECSEPLLEAVSAHLDRVVGDGRLFAALDRHLAEPGLQARLSGIAVRQRAIGLFWRLMLAGSRADRDGRLFRRCMNGALLSLKVSPDPSELELLYQIIWQGQACSVEDGLAILESAAAGSLASTSIPVQLAESTLRDSGNPAAAQQLADRLLRHPFHDSIGPWAIQLEAARALIDLRNPSLDAVPIVLDALHTADSLPPEQRAPLFGQASLRILELDDPAVQARLLRSGDPHRQEQLLQFYALQLDALLQRSKPTTERLLFFLQIWSLLDRPMDDTSGGQKMCQALGQMASHFSKRQRADVDAVASVDGRLNELWRSVLLAAANQPETPMQSFLRTVTRPFRKSEDG